MTDEELYERCCHPGFVRRLLSAAVFYAPHYLTGIAAGSLAGLLFLVSGTSLTWSVVIGLAAAVAATRMSITAWERMSGLTRVRPARESDEAADVELDDTDDVAADEPARTSDSPEVAAAR